jgi:metal-responsive CopG/Arc/MetJ family transcriptional regulator
MRAVKFAISMPRETMDQVDHAAKRLGMTRSRYIATVLERVARKGRDAAISRKVDQVLAEIEQELGTVALLRAVRRDQGTEW